MQKSPSLTSTQDLQLELAKKDELLASFQSQLEDLQKSKESAVKLLQASLRTETLLYKLNTRFLVLGSETLGVSELKEKAVAFSNTVMKRKSALAVPVLAACDAHTILEERSGNSPDLETIALEKIRVDTQVLIHTEYGNDSNKVSPCALPGAERMKDTLIDKKMQADVRHVSYPRDVGDKGRP
eukprot:scaffold4223_cov189-Amphora_coffeaeformis.AAC.46